MKPTFFETIHGRVKILYPTKIVDEKGSELFGLTNYNEKFQIAVQKGLEKRVSQQTMMHEIVHVLTMPFEVNLKEEEVEILAIQLVHLLKNNPKLIKYLTDK